MDLDSNDKIFLKRPKDSLEAFIREKENVRLRITLGSKKEIITTYI